MLIAVTEQIVHYKSKVSAIIVFPKREGSLWSVALGQNLSEGFLKEAYFGT